GPAAQGQTWCKKPSENRSGRVGYSFQVIRSARPKVLVPEVTALFDHLVGEREQFWRYGQAERVRSLEIDHEIELGRLLNRQVRGLGATDDPVHVRRGAPMQVGRIDAIGDQSAGGN